MASLFELELDTEKNQYETRQSAAASSEQQKEREIDDALKKLDELAKREEDLAQQQRNGTQTAEQKWQQEMLQREAEQLQRRMEQQLAQNGQKGQQGQQSQQNGQSGSASGQSGGQSSGQAGQRGGKAASSSAGRGGSGQSDGQDNPNGGDPQQSADQAADSRQQAAQQALDRLRQSANEDMRRAVSRNASAADSRRAADRLRQATDLLGGLQQQDAGGRLNSMAQTAGQLAARQKQQADHVRDLMAQQKAATASGRPPNNPSAQDIDKMVNDRQKVSDDLARLTQQLRDAARELGPTQPDASTKLRGALSGMDENDLGTRMQRSSDWLRGGQFSDAAETALTSDLQKLGQQVGDAARALGTAQHTSEDTAINKAMDDLSRLRDQLAGLGGRPNSQPGNHPGPGQPSGQQFQTGPLSRDGQPGQPGQAGQSGGQSGQRGQNGQPGQQGGQAGGGQSGDVGNRVGGPNGNTAGGGNRDSAVYGNLDTGNSKFANRAPTPQQPGPNPSDTQRQIDQGLNLLNQVRAAVQDSPEARQELQALIDQMRNLDPSRFPGNPALVEQMHQQLVSEVDALELQLRRQLDEKQGGTIRNPDPAKIPAGYKESVAEYYRKLSGGGH